MVFGEIPIEERASAEVTHVQAGTGVATFQMC